MTILEQLNRLPPARPATFFKPTFPAKVNPAPCKQLLEFDNQKFTDIVRVQSSGTGACVKHKASQYCPHFNVAQEEAAPIVSLVGDVFRSANFVSGCTAAMRNTCYHNVICCCMTGATSYAAIISSGASVKGLASRRQGIW